MTTDPFPCAQQPTSRFVSSSRRRKATVSATYFSAAVGKRYLRQAVARGLARRFLVVVNATTLHATGQSLDRFLTKSRVKDRSKVE